MGSTSSSAAAHKRSAGIPTHRRPVLSESDAWDIALAWRDQLHGCVRLETNTDQLPASIIPTFEWVTFVFTGTHQQGFLHFKHPKKTAAYARAATIAWFVLSCCEGYSGVENPQFWRRVFRELLYPKDLPLFSKRSRNPRLQIPITDAVRFFSHADRPFPRIKLVIWGDDEDAPIKCGFLGSMLHEDTTRDTKLQRILTKLQPFIRVSDGMRRVPVEIEMTTPLKPATHLGKAPSSGEMEPEALASVAAMMKFPQLYLRSVVLLDTTQASIHSRHSLIPPSDVGVYLRGDLPCFVQDNRLCSCLLDQLQTSDASEERHRRWRVTELRLVQNSVGLLYSYVSLLCSALPHLSSISTVTLPRLRYGKGIPSSIASDWAWMGYAIFHPDAASTSGFTSMEIHLAAITPADIAALANMTLGNNLLGDTNTGYLEGRLRCETEVRKRPVDKHEPSLHTLPAESWVALCVPAAAAADPLEYQGWVCIVVPGFGAGWIREDNIIETRSRNPGVSCIRALRVNYYCEQMIEEAITGLLGVLGDRLTSLHFQDSAHISASTVQTILRLCPSLKSLRIYHDGSFWADEALAMTVPRLEELELTVNGRHTQAWRQLQELKPACLPHLKTLRVISKTDFGYKQHILVSFLSNQRVLQYLHWSHGFDMVGVWVDASSQTKNEAANEAAHNFLGQLPTEYQLSHGPLQLNCRLAFLSVIREKAGRSGVGGLGEDVVSLIFQFSTSSSPREIYMNLKSWRIRGSS